MAKKARKIKRRQLTCRVAVEVSHSELSVVVIDQNPDSPRRVRGYRAQWLHHSAGLHEDAGVPELVAALAPIVEQEDLAGGSVHVTLSSDFCVTRVIADETDRMLSELRGLRDRSAHYLSLGAGTKAISQTIRSLDVKHSQAWLTVTNRDTLDRLCRAFEEAGLYPDLIEHSMVAVCRAAGRMKIDDTPAIIIEPSDRGVDLGISYKGQLLFDYRPGGMGSKESIARIVEQHLERIQRYCTRYFRFANAELKQVFLYGNPQVVEQVRLQFLNSKRLSADIINPASICAEWEFGESLMSNPEYVAPLGSALVEKATLRLPPDKREFPDLMDTYRHGVRLPLWPLVKRHLWPVAAAAVLGGITYGGALVQHVRAGSVEEHAATIEAEAGHAATLRMEAETLNVRMNYLKRLDDELAMLPVDELIAQVVRVKPRGVYLDGIQVSQDGLIVVDGKAERREAVFELEAGLKKLALLKSPWIESTRPDRLPHVEDATGFKLKAKFAGPVSSADRSTP